MIPPIKPVSRNLFFQYGQLPRMILGILREAKGPMALERIVDTVIEAKGLTVDRRVTAYQGHGAGDAHADGAAGHHAAGH